MYVFHVLEPAALAAGDIEKRKEKKKALR